MTYQLNDEEKLIVDMVRSFAEKEVRPIVQESDETNKFPVGIANKMKEIGFFGLKIPKGYGGANVSSIANANIFEDLSYGWMTSARVIGTHSLVATLISDHGTDEQKDKYLRKMASGEF